MGYVGHCKQTRLYMEIVVENEKNRHLPPGMYSQKRDLSVTDHDTWIRRILPLLMRALVHFSGK